MANWVWEGVYPQVFGCSRQLSLNKYFDPSILSMRKVDNGKRKEKRKEKIMSFLVATDVVASRPPKRRPTGTPHARAKNSSYTMFLRFPRSEPPNSHKQIFYMCSNTLLLFRNFHRIKEKSREYYLCMSAQWLILYEQNILEGRTPLKNIDTD